MSEYAVVRLRQTETGELRGAYDGRRTATHWRVLRCVKDRQVEWRSSVGPFGGFIWASGAPFQPGEELVALYELRNARMIRVDQVHALVMVTRAGADYLALHDSWRKAS